MESYRSDATDPHNTAKTTTPPDEPQSDTTNAKELIGYCEQDHHLKNLPGWTYKVTDSTPTTTPHGDTHTNPHQPLHKPLTPTNKHDTPPF
ncbi:hypothetical protein [Amycolatopsis cihanbeyliensis]|uniref:hypothetical protein n=1 Tax=Amycolatopsis cihanbeyliensis TaxID=1128664 RepID=UPI00114F8830|nr:hypothetical protein [Amycolatopsis cihanbeyliensis]